MPHESALRKLSPPGTWFCKRPARSSIGLLLEASGTKRESMTASRVTDHVFEVRYKPNARFLDYRGQWAELIAEHMKATEWRITENRLDVFDKSEARRFFLAFRNCGATIRD